MKIKLIFDNVNYLTKPKIDIGSIINRMTIETMKEYSIEEIKQNILDGKTNRPAYCGGKENSWKSQQVFMIDIDDNYTIEQAINKCKEISIIPNFIYTSFSHTEKHHKFRLVFILDKEITDFDIAKRIQLYLMNSIGNVDIVCKNLNRPYFAGKSIVFDSGNILNSDIIIELSKDIKITDKIIIRKKKSTTPESPRDGVLHNNDVINIPILSSTPKPHNSESDNYTIKAIRNRDISYLKNKYGLGDKIIFETNQEFIDYIRKEINLGELLEFHYPSSIKCIFHDDSNNSAGIFQADDGAWIYKCHSSKCNVTYNIIGVIERLANFMSRPKTYKFIKEMFNLEIMETEWQKEQKEILLENLKTLYDEEFEKNCFQTNKNIKGIKHYLERLTIIAMDNIHNENLTDEEGHVVFFASANYICKMMGISPNSINKVYQKLVVLTYHKLLNKLDDKELPERFLKRAMAININNNENKDNDNKINRINFFSIPSYTVNKFPEIEQRGKQWKENDYTMKGVSREMFYRTEGLEVANELYPQHKKVMENINGKKQTIDRTTTETSNIRTNNIVKAIHELINEYGYATENAIVENLRLKYAYITTQVQIKKSLKEILDIYNLKRIRANKEIKEQYRMTGNGYPFIIVKNN